MYAIILAGGYAKRLWPLTLDTPKALLPIAGRPILDYVVDKLEALNPPLTRIVLSTNLRFQPQFAKWLDTCPHGNILLLPDASESEAQKPGAIKAMANIVAFANEDDVLVIAGDGMFQDDLTGMMQTFKRRKAAVAALYPVRSVEEAKRCGIASADKTGKIVAFTEKPAEPTSLTACGAVYMFPRGIRKLLAEYMAEGLQTDQPGRFVEWLYRKEPVYGYTLKDYLWDIGTHEAYKECNQHFLSGNCAV